MTPRPSLSFVDLPTEEVPAITPELLRAIDESDAAGELDGMAASPTIDLRDLDDDREGG